MPMAPVAKTLMSKPLVSPTVAPAPLPRRRALQHLGALAALLGTGCSLHGCGGGSDTPPAMSPAAPAPAPGGPPAAVTFTSGLQYPWSLTWLPDGRILVTERPGRLRLVSADGKTVSAPITGVPAVQYAGQGGLLDVALDPAFATNRLVYLSYAEAGSGVDAGKNGTAVARGVLSADGTALGNLQVIFRQAPKIASGGHFGGRLVFAPDGKLFITLGERQSQSVEAQNLANTLGKVVRVNPDGSVPADNPFTGTAGAAPAIWSRGHRNVQGAAIHPDTGELWTCEHGPQGGDEVNVTRAGLNYGWPLISYGCNYGDPIGNCTPVGGKSSAPGLEQPLTYWVPTSIAPSGLAFYTGDRFPEWKGNAFVGALAGTALWRLALSGTTITAREQLFAGLGERIRDVRQGPDGWLYLLTDSSAGRIVRVQR